MFASTSYPSRVSIPEAALARFRSRSEARARSPGLAIGGTSRRTVSPAGGAAAEAGGGTSGNDGGGASGAGASAGGAPLPWSRTTFWHFGHFTLKGRSGTLASSMTIRCAQWGQLACTFLPLDQVFVDAELGRGRGRGGGPPRRRR